MAKIIGYVRSSTTKQENDYQKIAIYEYAQSRKEKVDEIIISHASSLKKPLTRRINELIDKLNPKDTLVVTEISRLGRSTAEVIGLINKLLVHNVRIVAVKQNFDISQYDMSSKIVVTIFSLLAELERDLISVRTKEALAEKKAKGIKLGKPIGTLQSSKFDKNLDRIKELLALGVSIRKITKILGYPSHSGLNTYLKKRKVLDRVKMAY